jgi:ferrous iron transport protein A
LRIIFNRCFWRWLFAQNYLANGLFLARILFGQTRRLTQYPQFFSQDLRKKGFCLRKEGRFMGLSLPEYQVGQPTFVLAVSADDRERGRLASLGIYPGAEIEVITKNSGGVLVAVGEARITIAQAAADQIMVA